LVALWGTALFRGSRLNRAPVGPLHGTRPCAEVAALSEDALLVFCCSKRSRIIAPVGRRDRNWVGASGEKLLLGPGLAGSCAHSVVNDRSPQAIATMLILIALIFNSPKDV